VTCRDALSVHATCVTLKFVLVSKCCQNLMCRKVSLVVCWAWWLFLSVEGSPSHNYIPTKVVIVGMAAASQDTIYDLKSVRDFIQRESDGLVYTTPGLN
jgi:hypothetical protein